MVLRYVQTAAVGLGTAGLILAYAPYVSALSVGYPRRADPAILGWAKKMLALAGVQAEAHGLENLPAGTCVMVCNHQSHYDGVMLFRFIPKHFRFVAKRELTRIPVFGQAVKLMGNLIVDRKGSQADRETLNDAVATVRDHLSVMFFPEGTRSEEGTLRRFKKGAAMLAIQAQVPVVPIAVSGTRHILPKGSKAIQRGQKAVLLVGKPLPTAGLQPSDRDALTKQLEQAVAQLYAEARERSGDLS